MRKLRSSEIMFDDRDETQVPLEHSTNSSFSSPCPTCRGTGSVRKSNGLVALIPVDDQRLKGRHLCRWVILTMIISLIVGGVLLALLLPRPVHLISSNPRLIDVTNQSDRNQTVYQFSFTHQIRIQSKNFVPIRLVNLSTNVEHQLISLSSRGANVKYHSFYLKPRGTLRTNLTIQLSFDNKTMAFRVCQGTFRQLLVFKIRTILTYTDVLVGRIDLSNDVVFQYVLCNEGDWQYHDR